VNAGVDGCRGGWAVALDAPGGVVTVVARRIVDVLALADGVIAIDMPIGLPDVRAIRPCDTAARRALGPRRSSVFPAPSRAAMRAHRWSGGLGISKQAWNLVPKVFEVDDRWEPRMSEVHPELAFALLAGAPLATKKSTPEGLAERRTLLREVFPHAEVLRPLPGIRPDDVLDALACLWSAGRIAEGAAASYGDGTLDSHGRPMLIRA
jgi:predicted RNase H-like nuclease